MSLITSFLPQKEEELIGAPVEDPVELDKFTAEAKLVTAGGRACEIETIVENEDKLFQGPEYDMKVFSDNQRFVENSMKVDFLKNICFNIPKWVYWCRPETSTVLAAKYAIRMLSGATNMEYINNLLIKNPGIFNYIVPVYKMTQNIFRTGGLKNAKIPIDLHRAIVCALIEIMNLNRNENFRGLAIGTKWLRMAGCHRSPNHKKSFHAKDTSNLDYTLTSVNYVCFECGELGLDAKQLGTHAKTHSKFYCRSCELTFKTYDDLSDHFLTFCREPFRRGKCNYCGKSGGSCVCMRNMAKTWELAREYLSSQDDDIKTYIFESDFLSAFVHYLNKQLTGEDLRKESFANPEVDGAEDINLFPVFTFEGNHLCIDNYNLRVMVSTIKKSLAPQCKTYDVAHEKIVSYMDTVRAKCPYSPCLEEFSATHLNEKHFMCSMAGENNQEKVKIYSGPSYLVHLIGHYKDDFPDEVLICPLCDFDVRDQGHILSFAHHYDDKHLISFKNHHCKIEEDECSSLYFTTMTAYISHCFGFHVNDKETLMSVLPVVCEDVRVKVLPPDQAVAHLSDLNIKDEVKNTELRDSESSGSSNSNKNVVDNLDGFTMSSFPSDRVSSNAIKKSFKVSAGNGDKVKVDGGDDDPQKGEGDYLCMNEEHEKKPRFKTKDLLDLHVISRHRCSYYKCSFSTMMSCDLLKHYRSKHVKETCECPICGASVTDLDSHQKTSHPKCPSCLQLFDTLNDLQTHTASGCDKAKMEVNKKTSTPKVVTLEEPDTSLNLDSTNTDHLFNTCLMRMLEASNMSEEEKALNRKIIDKHTSEALLTKNRLRNDSLGAQRSQNLLFEIPIFSTEVGASNNITKAASLLGTVKSQDIFNANPKEAAKQCIANFEKVEILCRKLHTVTTLCALTESQARCFLTSYLSQQTQDIIQGYCRREIHHLSYKEIVQYLQTIWIPLNLNILEKRIYSYCPGPSEDLFSFSSRITRHLSIVAKRLPEKDRDQYIEEGISKILRSHLPSEVAKTVEAKESLFSKFSSSEILDTYLYYNNRLAQADEVEEQYDIFSNQVESNLRTGKTASRGRGPRGPPSRPPSGRGGRGRESNRRVNELRRGGPSRGSQYRGDNRNSAPKREMSEKSRDKIKALGPRYAGKRFCFSCLDLDNFHYSRNCPKGYQYSENLCYKMVGGRKIPHGYHAQCKEGNGPNGTRGDGNRPSWGPK